jgi:probable rRNA maturation factor
MKLQLNVQYGVKRAGLPAESALRVWARTALKGVRRQQISLGLRIVGNAESMALNARYRHKPCPTNVLSFAFEAPPGARSDVLGDLAICAPVVRREARAQHKTLEAHWAHMVVHGILHLRGYDHRKRQEAVVMEKKEIRLLKELGYANPYI